MRYESSYWHAEISEGPFVNVRTSTLNAHVITILRNSSSAKRILGQRRRQRIRKIIIA